MKKRNVFTLTCLLLSVFTLISCSDDENAVEPKNDAEFQTEILTQTANNVCEAAYIDMQSKTQSLLDAVVALMNKTTDDNLMASRGLWKDVRTTWEQSEAWLFGPVSSDNIDPRIDTWPIDFNALEAILAGEQQLTEEYVDGLEAALKGFHPIEYLLWGENGNKTAAEFTQREKEFLVALAQNLNNLSKEVKNSWTNGYTAELATAGNGSSTYSSQKVAFLELVGGMAGICDEVANGKIKDPFEQGNPSALESPFAQNSIIDFTNNIKGVMVVYKGNFTVDGKGIEDLVREHNLQLDNQIKAAYNAAIVALDAIDVSFGEAIINKPNKVQNAMDKINALKDLLENELDPFIQQYGE